MLKDDRVAAAAVGQLNSNNTDAFTVISMIYTVCTRLLDKQYILGQTWTRGKLLDSRRPPAKQLDALYQAVCEFWDGLPEHFAEIKAYMDDGSKGKASDYRTASGGHLLFRPIGLDVFSRAYRKLRDGGSSAESAFETLNGGAYDLASDVWVGLLWNKARGAMITLAQNREVAADLLLRQAGVPVNEQDLLERYRKVLDNPEKELPAIEENPTATA